MKIAVDAGHGYNTSGKRTPPLKKDLDMNKDGMIDVKKGESIREHVAAVGVAYLLVQELKRCGFETLMVGFNNNNPKDDKDIPLSTRQKSVVNARCDYSVSIHFNAFGNGKSFNLAEGVGIYIHNKYGRDSKKLAKTVLKYLVKGTKQKNRGVKKLSLAMCNCNSLNVKAAILVEAAFMTNEREAVTMVGNSAFWKETAQEVCRGICKYTGVKYRKEVTIPKKKNIHKRASKKDIMWLQQKLNAVMEGESFIPLTVDGIYGSRTRIAVLIYWEKLGWNQKGRNSGWNVGKGTINALKKARKK